MFPSPFPSKKEFYTLSLQLPRPPLQRAYHGSVDFSTLKLKLIASIVAISGIHLLKVFMDVHKNSESQIKWMLIIHISFVVSGVLLALMDRIAAGTKVMKKK